MFFPSAPRTRAAFALPALLLLSTFVLHSPAVQAWDSVGHRLTAAVALRFMEQSTASELLRLLAAHPRYQQDFLDEMPDFVSDGSAEAQARWLLGQAAYWPDIARGIEEPDRERFNRPWWHYTDGAWIRGSAALPGNRYSGVDAFATVDGESPESITDEEEVSNIVTAIDYNSRLLADPSQADTDRAVALCWVLHLMGDIHQPLHTGSMYSAHVFERGDLGGNRILLIEGNLHGRWDSALYEEGIEASLPELISRVSGFTAPRVQGVESDWTAWMAESRQILRSWVYTPEMIAAVESADRAKNADIRAQRLSPEYVTRMKETARQRLGLAGLRLAIWFENEMPD